MIEVLEHWLASGKPAVIAGKRLRPLGHTGRLIIVTRGQADTVFLNQDNGRRWVLKRFRQGQHPDSPYLESIARVLPKHKALRSGTDRILLSACHLTTKWGSYRNKALARYLDGTVLMPRVSGQDWASVADELRAKERTLSNDNRVALCRDLAEVVQLLESNGCAHRDLSCGNAFCDTKNWSISLIDFDSVYHARLPIPARTTCGTEGYAAPFACRNRDPRDSWCPEADRFALAILCTEFLTLDSDAPLAGDGGMFTQDELLAETGPALDRARDRLCDQIPAAESLLCRALAARRFSECPSPAEWIYTCDHPRHGVVSIRDLRDPQLEYFDEVLRRRRNGMVSTPHAIQLPPDPWLTEGVGTSALRQT